VKKCSKCGDVKELIHFHKDKSKKDLLRPDCKSCSNATQRIYVNRNYDVVVEQKKNRYLKNKESILAYNRVWIRAYRANLKADMLAAYGNKCACCGEDEPLFLELDHIHNDGAACRRAYGNQFMEWVDLRKQGWPKQNHQLLCANCNKGKLRNNGICPHKTKNLF
jgi:hypothetical protein